MSCHIFIGSRDHSISKRVNSVLSNKRNAHHLSQWEILISIKTVLRNFDVLVASVIYCESALPCKSLLCQCPLCSGPLGASRSITGVTTSRFIHCSASPWHGRNQMRNCGTTSWDRSHYLMQRCQEFLGEAAAWGWVLFSWKSARDLRHRAWLRVESPCPCSLGVVIQHNKCSPAPTVYPTPKHHTPATPMVLFNNAGIGLAFTSATPYSDPPITMRDKTMTHQWSEPVSNSEHAN